MSEIIESIHEGDKYDDRVRKLGNKLSPREKEILGYLSVGKSIEEIANLIERDINTVETHRQNAMIKLDASTERQAVAIWNEYRRATTYE